MDLTPRGAKTPGVTANFEIIVDKLVGDGANITYKALFGWHGKDRLAAKDVFQTQTFRVAPDAMPSDYSSVSEGSGAAFVCSAIWITPDATCQVGKPMSIHWKNDAKDTTIDGQGAIAKLDKAARTMSVDWDLTLSFGGDKADLKVKSVYSTDDFSLISAKGSLASRDKKDHPFDVAITRVVAK
jgi:hypothetical protein